MSSDFTSPERDIENIPPSYEEKKKEHEENGTVQPDNDDPFASEESAEVKYKTLEWW